MSILIVDPSPVERTLMQEALRSGGHGDTETMATAAELLERVDDPNSAPPDVILVAVELPGGGGIELCRALRSGPTRGVPVILVSSVNDERTIEAAFAAGCTDYLGKPVRFAELLGRVGAAIRARQEIELLRARERDLLDVAQHLDASKAELRRRADQDGLTGIANRRGFEDALAREWRRAQHSQQPLTVALVDVDFFKRFNDSHGHGAGDDCLRRVAAALAVCARRPSDLVARYGGEEFGVLLPNTHDAGAGKVAAALRVGVADLAIPHGASDAAPHVTVSVGVATMIALSDLTAMKLVRAADIALYRAKRSGRDRVAVWGADDRMDE